MVSELRAAAATVLAHCIKPGDPTDLTEIRAVVDAIVEAAKQEIRVEVLDELKAARDEIVMAAARVTGVPPDVHAAGPAGVAESKVDDLSDEQTGGHIGNAPGGA
jgi:hypothetical protein